MTDGLASRCRACVAQVATQRRLADPAAANEIKRRYRKRNVALLQKRAAEYRARPGQKEKRRASNREWTKKNAAKNRAKVRAHEAKKLRAMPAWADRTAIQKFYDEAVRLSRVTGIPHQVDHIVPLNHPLVCGLHVPANLRVISAAENAAKRNRHWPGILECQRVVR